MSPIVLQHSQGVRCAVLSLTLVGSPTFRALGSTDGNGSVVRFQRSQLAGRRGAGRWHSVHRSFRPNHVQFGVWLLMATMTTFRSGTAPSPGGADGDIAHNAAVSTHRPRDRPWHGFRHSVHRRYGQPRHPKAYSSPAGQVSTVAGLAWRHQARKNRRQWILSRELSTRRGGLALGTVSGGIYVARSPGTGRFATSTPSGDVRHGQPGMDHFSVQPTDLL
jgi:hypothetical protein